MGNRVFDTLPDSLPELVIDMGDKTYARRLAVVLVDANGNVERVVSLGRAGAAASKPVVLSTEDKAALDLAAGVYRRAEDVGATPGHAILINPEAAGAVTLTLSGGGTISVKVGTGSVILPFAVTAASAGTTGATFKSLFMT